MAIAPLIDRVKARAAAQAQRVMGRLSRHQRQSMAESEIQEYLNDSMENADTPSFKAHFIDENEPPDPLKYRDTWESARSDVLQLLYEAKESAVGLKHASTRRELLSALLNNELQELESRVQAVELFAEGATNNIEMMVIEFTDPSMVDPSLVIGHQAKQDTKRGVLTSAVKELQNRTSQASVVPVVGDTSKYPWGHGLIGDKSNGLPGNTHEVVPVTITEPGQVNGPDTNYEFVGAEDARLNHAYILDQSLDTWFEYEAINVPQSVIEETKGYGWAWRVGENEELRWVFDPPGGVLKLTLRVRFDEPILANEIVIHPFIPPNEGAKPPILKSVKVIDEGDEPSRELAAQVKQGARGEWTLTFPSQRIQTLDFSFEQPDAFNVLVGHYAFWRKTTIERTRKALFGLIKSTTTQTNVRRVDGPNPPITALGVTENPDSLAKLGAGIAQVGAIAYAIGTAAAAVGAASLAGVAALGPIGLAAVGVGVILAGLFGSTTERVVSDEIEVTLEAFEGVRWCIGIREIEVLSKVYHDRSMWVSRPLQTSEPIRAIRIDADEYIPNGFPKDAVRYEISVDDGENWYPISPSSSWDGDAPEIIYIGGNEAVEGDPRRVGIIEADNPHSLRLRVILSGASDRPFESARIDRITIWAHTGGAP